MVLRIVELIALALVSAVMGVLALFNGYVLATEVFAVYAVGIGALTAAAMKRT